MDEKDLMKSGMEIMLRPVTNITENALGLLGGDWLSEKRARNRARLKQETENLLERRNIKLDTDPSPSVVMPLLSAAQDEGREELIKLWAALLAAGSDPALRGSYRREFVDIVKKLEPPDILLLERICGPKGFVAYHQREAFPAEMSLTGDQVEISAFKLIELGLVDNGNFRNVGNIVPTSLARELCRVIKGEAQ